jgi:predicted amidohydrolase
MMEKPIIALAQMTVGPDREANRQKAEQFIKEAAGMKATLVAFPEISFDPFFPQYPSKPEYFDWAEKVPGPTTERFAALAQRNVIGVLLNLLQKGEPGQYFDGTAVIDSCGNLLGVSQMMHICDTPGFHEKYYYWPGQTDFPVFDMAGLRVAPCICYDRHYPEMMRILTLRGARLIVVQTATTREEAGQVLEAEMQAAALANGVYVALVNRAGVDGKLHFAGRSLMVSPDGTILKQSQTDGDDLLTAELEPEAVDRARVVWPFLRDRRPEIYDPLLFGLEQGE